MRNKPALAGSTPRHSHEGLSELRWFVFRLKKPDGVTGTIKILSDSEQQALEDCERNFFESGAGQFKKSMLELVCTWPGSVDPETF
jgi:hypothetical protein